MPIKSKEINAVNCEIALPRGFVTPRGNFCPLNYRGNGTYEVSILAEEKFIYTEGI